MSGDVQPRKRNKDKKRRRDDDETRPAGVHATKMGPDDIQLHIHSDHGTGGHWCAKVFFFSLLAILLGLIGLILLENRGLADLDTPLSESRFADMLEGWVDEERQLHDEHDVHTPDEHDDDHDEQNDDSLANNEASVEDETENDELNELKKDEDPEDVDQKDEGFDESGETEYEDNDNDDNDDGVDGNEDNDDDDDEDDEETNQEDNLNEEIENQLAEDDEEDDDDDDNDNEDDDDDDDANNDNNDDIDEGIVADPQVPQENNDLDDDSENDIENQDDENDIPDVEKSRATDDDDNDVQQLKSQPDQEEEEESSSQIDRSGPASFSSDDHLIDEEIRKANEQLAEDPLSTLTLFERIRQTYPTSKAAQYGIARSLDILADLKRSNGLLRRAIEEYETYISLDDKLDDTEFKVAAERCIERMRFIGEHTKAVPVHEKLIQRFDDNPYYRNQLAVTYLLVNRLADAKYILHITLQRWRDDGFAAVHYGFVLKNLDNNLEHAVIFLRQGIESGASGTSDGRFYFNLGDALIRLGRHDEAKEIFKEAAKKKLFPSEYQRSLYNLDHLKAQPFWTLAETGYKHEFQTLEQNWKRIRDEGLHLLNDIGYFSDESENLRDTGIWKQFELFARGQRNNEHCKRASFTCKLIETFPAARFCKRGQVKFSVMHPNTHVWPHCGPTNCRLRAHLGLKTADKTSIRVATETRTWTEGKIMIFDDSFEHEVWHNGTTYRLILIVDVWHPGISADEKKTLVPI